MLNQFFSDKLLRYCFSTGFAAGLTISCVVLGIIWLGIVIALAVSGAGLLDILMTSLFSLLIMAIPANLSNLWLMDKDKRGLVVLVGYLVKGAMPVVLKDYHRDTYYSLAWPDDAGVWRCPIYYGTGVGDVKLNPNGSCGNESYIYFWQPLRDSDRMQFFLHNEDVVYFDDLAGMDRQDISKLVSKMRKEAQNVV
jgi:hypothetical protein